MKDWWKKFNSLTSQDKWLLIKALWNLIHLSFALRIPPFHYFKKYYRFLPATSIHPLLTLQYAKAIRRASTLVPSIFTCLPQALTLKKGLKDCKLIIGVQASQTLNLDAHAWVERDKQILIGEFPTFEYLPLWVWE